MGKIVGILSMQRVLNYGSFLQAYALKQLLLKNGADEVCFIDIEPGRQLPGFSNRKQVARCRKILRLIGYVLHGKLLLKIRDKRFAERLAGSIAGCFPLLGLEYKTAKLPDLVVIGSDEVFNCCQATGWGYTLQLYGDIPYAER